MRRAQVSMCRVWQSCRVFTLGYNKAAGLFRSCQGVLPMWTKPTYTDLRIGFEVTMYFASR
jgi:coenzyme PQQ precursor peptide PqqA